MFQPLEKFSTVRLVVSEVLTNPAHVFTLSAYGKVITDEDVPLAQLGLVSCVLIVGSGSYTHTCVHVKNLSRVCVQLFRYYCHQRPTITGTFYETMLGSVLLPL